MSTVRYIQKAVMANQGPGRFLLLMRQYESKFAVQQSPLIEFERL